MWLNLAEDEVPILLAETEEHLQTLAAGLVRLECADPDPELLQAIFRAAHTLKGNASMVGLGRMADLTHALETLLDGLRRQTLALTPAIVEASRQALVVLELLYAELLQSVLAPQGVIASQGVLASQPAQVEVDPVVRHLLSFCPAPLGAIAVGLTASEVKGNKHAHRKN